MQFKSCTPESVGVPSSAVENLLDKLESYGVEMHSLLLLRHGKAYAKGWWKPYAPDIPHIMFSFSKSLTSTAIGFAEQEGLLTLDEKIIDIFPDKAPECPSENLLNVNIAHVLMMGCGHEKEIPLTYADSDWISSFFRQPFVYEPGTHFLYNTAGSNLLSAIIQRKSGQKLTQYLYPRLFKPLGMRENIACVTLPDGVEAGGFGYYLTTEEMGAFIQFVLQKGMWNGEQRLNSDWFNRATAKQIENRDPSADVQKDWGSGYGYQFWRCSVPGVFRGDGAFGQIGMVMPEQDAAVVLTSASLDLQLPLDAIYETLLAAMVDRPLPENKEGRQRLYARLNHLELAKMTSMRRFDREREYDNVKFIADFPIQRLAHMVGGAGIFVAPECTTTGIVFSFSKDKSVITALGEKESASIDIGLNGKFAITHLEGMPIAANSRWRTSNILEIEMRNLLAASGTRYLFEFDDGGVSFKAENTIPENGGLIDEKRETIYLRRSEV